MRVLHISSGNMYGGVETFLTTLVREAGAAPGMKSEFALCFEGRLSGELETLGCAPHLLGPARLSRPLTVVRARRRLELLLRRGAYDVVVCHQPWTCVLFASPVRAAGFPVAMWVHMAESGRHWLERLARLTRPDLAICNSKFSASRLARWLDCERIEQVYCPLSLRNQGIDAESRRLVRRQLDTFDDDTVVVQVSRLEEWKGQRMLLAALSRLRDLPGWTCWIVGGAQRPSESDFLLALRHMASRERIADRVRFVGERHDVPHVLAAADVFCQPNTEPEPFGLSLVEAMHAGLPVITSGVGGACEIVDGSCGALTPPGDVPALARALERLIVDRRVRANLGAAARRRPQMLCDPGRQMRRIQSVLEGVTVPGLASGRSVQVELR